MLIDLKHLPPIETPGMNGGTGTMTSRVHVDPDGKVILCALHPGASIGTHRHDTSDDVNYVLSGAGKAVCNGETEELRPGVCHVCRKGSEHSIENCGEEDLVLLTIVCEKQV